MPTFIVDVETTFSSEHTLQKLSMEEYVRHPKFEVIGWGVKRVGACGGDPEWYTRDEFFDFLFGIQRHDFPVTFVAHKAHFDMFVMQHVYGYQPDQIQCTLSMARARYPMLQGSHPYSLDHLAERFGLGTPKTVPYNQFRGKTAREIYRSDELYRLIVDGCCHDVELTAALYDLLRPSIPENELGLIDATIRMYTEPMLIGDWKLLHEALVEAVEAQETKLCQLGLTEDVIRSDKKFASLLHGAGVEPPQKVSPTTGKLTYAFAKTDPGLLALADSGDEYVRDLVECRIAVKTSIHETRAGRFLDMSQRGPMPVFLQPWGAHTGRFSGGDKTNFQNLTKGSKLRQALRAPAGHKLVWADLSQIECRLLAEVANCAPLLDSFREGRDIYSEFGSKTFGCEVSKTINRPLRELAKKTVLGCGFGMGASKFFETCRKEGHAIDWEQAQLLRTSYRAQFKAVPRLWRALDQVIVWMESAPSIPDDTWSKLKDYPDDNGVNGINPLIYANKKCHLPNDMAIDYTSLRYDYESQGFVVGGTNHIWGGVLTENAVQALARIVMTNAWLALLHAGLRLLGARVVLTVHDELVLCVPDKYVGDVIEALGTSMVQPPEWMPDLPLACEVFTGENYDKSGDPKIFRSC